jgi:hypothetical protein
LNDGDIRRLTNNNVYDAEVSVSPDGKMDLWRMRPDGAEEFQITHFEGWEPGAPSIWRTIGPSYSAPGSRPTEQARRLPMS